MSDYETPKSLEHARQIDQSDHEHQAFERSDAAKVAAVAALVELGESQGVGYQLVACSLLRKALADPDAALERVRAEVRAEALREVSCSVCDDLILPDVDACPDGDRWAHRDCMEAGE